MGVSYASLIGIIANDTFSVSGSSRDYKGAENSTMERRAIGRCGQSDWRSYNWL